MIDKSVFGDISSLSFISNISIGCSLQFTIVGIKMRIFCNRINVTINNEHTANNDAMIANGDVDKRKVDSNVNLIESNSRLVNEQKYDSIIRCQRRKYFPINVFDDFLGDCVAEFFFPLSFAPFITSGLADVDLFIDWLGLFNSFVSAQLFSSSSLSISSNVAITFLFIKCEPFCCIDRIRIETVNVRQIIVVDKIKVSVIQFLCKEIKLLNYTIVIFFTSTYIGRRINCAIANTR